MKSKKPFSLKKTVTRSRGGKSARRIVKSIPKQSKISIVRNIADIVLRKIPVDMQKFTEISDAKKRFKKSIRTTAEKSLASKKNSIGLLHCVERCNVALALLREAKIPCWTARQVYLDLTTKRFGVHDFVEFYIDGKVHTLAFGHNYISGDYSRVYNKPLEKVLSEKGENIFIQNMIFRGVDSSQIGGTKDHTKLKRFLRFPFSSEQIAKNNRRVNLMVESKIIPKNAYNQIRGIN